MTSDADDITAVRAAKLERLRAAGRDPYPSRFARTHNAAAVKAKFEQLTAAAELVAVAGRAVFRRPMGRLAFVVVQDGTDRLQLAFRQDVLGEAEYELFKDTVDLGDWLGVRGTLFRTRTGEMTVEVRQWEMLAKALRPPPGKWHGLQDVELRLRRRYLDLLANSEERRSVELRSQMVAATRRYLDGRGFLEVETPVLQSVAGGAAARVFETYVHALDQSVCLRIALELYLKRCIIGGIERVYEIGRNFRNEGISFKHHPEFTMLELYEAYADYRDMMQLTEDLVSAVAREVLGTTRMLYGDDTIDFSPPWRRLLFQEVMEEFSGVDYERHADTPSLARAAGEAGLAVAPDWNRGKILDELFSAFVEPRLTQPTFLVDYPVGFPGSTLAKRKPERESVVERFEAVAGGMEFANAFTELNDPLDQRRRFLDQTRLKAAGDLEAETLDEEFLEALEHGMPPTGGLGLGIDRLAMLFTNRRTIREVILFPMLRRRQDP